jgi:hypothetical protein
MKNINWKKSLLNSLIAWLFSFLFSIIIAAGYAVYLLFKYDFKNSNTGKISEEINSKVGLLFAENFIVIISLIIVSALLIFWRSHIVAKKVNENNILDGIVVSLMHVLYTLSFGLHESWLITNLVTIILYISSGVLGSAWKLEHKVKIDIPGC